MSDLTLFTDTSSPPTAGGVTVPVVHGAVIISAVETAWREIRRRFTGVPDISVTVPPPAGAQDPTKCTALRTGRRFVREGHLTLELQVSSDTLGLGGRPLMEGLLNHAAHGLALTRDIVDVSGGDRRWHKNRYKLLAREVGLTPPARAARVIDMGRCPLSDAGAERWAEVIAALDDAAGVQLGAAVQAVAPPRGGRSGARFAIVCECTPVPRRQQVAPFFYEQGPLLCGVCLTKFRPADAVLLPAQTTGEDA
ncbi:MULTISPECIES: hypothetical protein [unclassified Streptomyces]|uniref:hypothetical protein n=1 Tax=Streptomyces sp. SID5789 TaxID=2690310 RepID=UPI00136D332C|nr:hypothetical protein [Streptomyces sp. SID5789]